jgi:hypothetical protein
MSLHEHRPLILRSNRFLATVLLDKKLVTVEQLEAANEKLQEYVQIGDLRRANILHILMFEMQVLNEDLYLDTVIEQYGLGLIDLHGCQFRKFNDLKFDLTACWATWTVPFDLVDDFHLLATAFYPSQPAVKFWTDKYEGANVQWYVTSVRSLTSAFERLEHLKNEAVKAAQPVAASKPARPAKMPAPAMIPPKPAAVIPAKAPTVIPAKMTAAITPVGKGVPKITPENPAAKAE